MNFHCRALSWRGGCTTRTYFRRGDPNRRGSTEMKNRISELFNLIYGFPNGQNYFVGCLPPSRSRRRRLGRFALVQRPLARRRGSGGS